MHKKLIIKAFDKARILRKKQGEKQPSKVVLAEDISDYIDLTEKFRLGEKRFRDYYREARKLKLKKEDITINKIEVVIGLCRFIGYNSYEEFISSVNVGNLHKLMKFIKKFRLPIFIIISIITIILIIFSINRQRWMIWEGNHYVKTSFDSKKVAKGELKLYKIDRIKYFKKVEADCNTVFFSQEGNVKIWYGKNEIGKLEYFTDLGLHPETGKTLKPITRYMINKYICSDY